jgi:gamma-glutamylcyclotransferase (GGCT)/AIG2-like uncharacterized protein YtfP
VTTVVANRLAAYGTLRPGESNYHVVEMINGIWHDGTVTGILNTEGRYPTFKYSANGPEVSVKVLVSDELPEHWQRIDEFEGNSYTRQEVPVKVNGESWMCNIYEAR